MSRNVALVVALVNTQPLKKLFDFQCLLVNIFLVILHSHVLSVDLLSKPLISLPKLHQVIIVIFQPHVLRRVRLLLQKILLFFYSILKLCYL